MPTRSYGDQAEVNSQSQSLSSPSLRDAVTLAVVEDSDSHERTDLFHAKGDIEGIHLLGKLLYLDVHGDRKLN